MNAMNAMNAMIQMGPRHVGQASGSTSKICRRSANRRRVASEGASRGVGTIVSGSAVGSASRNGIPRGGIPRGRMVYQP